MTLSTITESSSREVNDDEAAFPKLGCSSCSCLPLAGRRGPVLWERINHSGSGRNGTWWENGWRRVRTLVRLIGRRKGAGKFRYDPLSYSLNFDDGAREAVSFADDYYRRGFSSRYSLPPSSRSSLDFDKEGLSFM